jgi:3-deoxy-D-manno-octulosonic-acid transferase
VTSYTPSGSRRITELFGDRVQHAYLPFDTPGAVTRFLGRARPRLALVMETEIWPNLYRSCAMCGIPLVMVSARLSQESLDGYRHFPGLAVIRDSLESARAAAQTPQDAERLRMAGVREQNISVCGNLKFDYPPDAAVVEAGRQLRREWGAELRPVWIAASTHAGEEAAALEVHEALCERRADALLVLVPRHPQRFEEVARLCAGSELRVARRGRREACGADTQVLLADTLGELNMLYAAADIAFVGGSLVPVGGHNLLEPASLGLPILVGPHLESQRAIAEPLLATGAAIEVVDAQALEEKLEEMFESDVLRRQAGAAARHVIESSRGTLARVLALLSEYLPVQGPASASRPS